MLKQKTEFTLLFLILVLGAFLRFWWIADFPLGLYPDEAMNGSNALEALSTGDFKWFYPENNGREGLFINIQAFSVWLFGNTPWAPRIVSGLFGTLTILGVYLLTKELFRDARFRKNTIKKRFEDHALLALLASFFIATSYWHINFSRIGFRAISVPFFSSLALYFLLRGLRRGKISDLVFGGIFMGLGFHTYIAFRFMPFVIAVPIIWYLWKWAREGAEKNIFTPARYSEKIKSCIPCAVALFLLVTFATALPIGLYFLEHPADFAGRSTQVSIFAAESPIKEFAKSSVLTLGMYVVYGDCNGRHNYLCQPELHPLVALSFFAGLIAALTYVISALRKRPRSPNESETTRMVSFLLLFWFFMMTFPATLTREGLPHALRAIGTIPPVMILGAFGALRLYYGILNWFERQKEKFADHTQQLSRIQKELAYFLAIIFLVIPFQTYYIYFFRWAPRPDTYRAFATDNAHLGEYLNSLPRDVKKYVVVNAGGVDVRGIPMSAQTVMFLTDSFREKGRREHNIVYLKPEEITDHYFSDITANQKTMVAFINNDDNALIEKIKRQNPGLKPWVPEDFITLKNF